MCKFLNRRFPQRKISSLVIHFLIAATLLSIPTARAEAEDISEVLTNTTVIELYELGFDEEIIIGKIKNTKCEFEVDIDNLKNLKEHGIPSSVITEMINTITTSGTNSTEATEPEHAAGIYVSRIDQEGETLEKIEPSTYTQTKSGGFLKSMLTYGALKAKTKAILAREQARVIVKSQPTFFFYFEETQSGLSSQSQGGFSGQRTTTNPGEFILAQFKVKSKNQNRELVVAKIGAFGSVESGAIDETVRQFDYEKLSPGVYKVTPQEPLEDGEYCFYFAGSATPVYGFWGGGNQVFDFSVRLSG